MNIKGILKTSLVDYPGRLTTVIFLGGCNLECRYCHNPELICGTSNSDDLNEVDILELIKKRSSLVDSVVITGGEPTLSKEIISFLQKIKEIPLSVKLDTNGSNPALIEELLEKKLVDYVAVDVKTSPEKYQLVTGKDVDFNNIKNTIDIIKKSGVDYELRTTCIPHFVTLDDFKMIKNEVGIIKKYYLQQFVNKVTLDSALKDYKPYSVSVLNEFMTFVKTFADVCEIRGI